MAAKIKGPLSLGSEAADTDYNSQMRDLMGQLVQTPEQQRDDELLAWSGGLTDPNGQGRIGDAMINASKAQSNYRMEDRKLRAQYIPLIMSALGTQAQAQPDLSIGSLKGMPLETVYAYKVRTGKDLLPEWKVANGMESQTAGTYQKVLNPQTNQWDEIYLGKPGEQSLKKQADGSWAAYNPAGTAQATAELAQATAVGKGTGENLTKTGTYVDTSGTKREAPLSVLQPQLTQLPAHLLAPSVGQVPPTPQPPQGALSMGQAGPPPGPSGGVTVPQMPPGLSAPMPPGDNGVIHPSMIPPPGVDHPPPIPKEQQAARNTTAIGLMQTELVKAQQRLAAAQTPVEQQRAQNDIAAVTKELSRAGGKAPTVATAPTATAPAVQQAPVGVQVERSPVQELKINAAIEGNKRWNDEYKDLQIQGRRFADEERNINQISTAFKKMGQTGTIDTPLRKGAAEVLSFFGVPADSKYLTNYEMAQQGIKERVNAAIRADAGVATQGDANRHEQAMVSLTGKPEYNEYMLDVYRATLERNREKLDFYTKGKQRGIPDGNLERITDAWQTKAQKPLADYPSMKKWKERYGW